MESERDEFLRSAWRVEVSERLEAGRFAFVDEMGTNSPLSPFYGWAKVRSVFALKPQETGART